MSIKRNSSEEEWWRSYKEPTYSKEYINEKIAKTVKDIQSFTQGKKIAVAWSGGKDSIALQEVMERANIDYEIFIVISHMEYPEFMTWINDNKPQGLSKIIRPHDFSWLSENEDMLFPQDSNKLAKWYKIIQHHGQKGYAKNNNIDVLVLGRRKPDGNYVGRGTNHYQKKSETFERYSPLADWGHEEIMALLSYSDKTLPPIYKYPNGFKNGTHPIGARPNTNSYKQAYDELYTINPKIVEHMAKYLETARKYISEVEQ